MASLINVALGFNYNKGIMNTVVGDIGNLTNVSAGATKAVTDLSSKMSLLQKVQGLAAVGNLVSNITSSVKGLAGEVKVIFDFAGKYASRGDKIAKTSRLVGLSVHDYQAFSSAAQHSGMSVEEMDNAFKRFNVTLGKAKSGDANSLKMFGAILGGKSVKDFSNSSDLLASIADGYTKLSSAEQKAFVTQELFGRGGQKISELFKDGGDSLKDYLKNYKAAFNDDSAKSAELFDDTLQDAAESFESMKTSVAVGLFPIFTELFDSVKDFFNSKDSDDFKKEISEIAKVAVGFVKDSLPKIPKVLGIIVSIMDLIGPKWSAALTAFVAAIPFLISIGACIGSVASLLSGPVLLGVGLVVSAVALWGNVVMKVLDNWAMLKSFIVDDVWGAIKQFFSDCIDAVNDWVNMFVEDVEWLWNGFKSIFIDPFVVFFTSLPDMMSDLWQGFKDGVSQIGSFIYNTFFGSIASAINGAKDLLKSLPLVGGLFADSGAGANVGAQSQIATAVQQSYSTTTNRFAVDFQNMPQGVRVTPPDHGDFDWSRSYTLAGAV